MNFEDYYGTELFSRLKETQGRLEKTASEIQNNGRRGEDLQPVVYFSSRIKEPESMQRKLEKRGLADSPGTIIRNIYDAVGLRIVCSFESDVHQVVGALESRADFTVIEKKDYLSYPKPNGYRSIHLCVRMTGSDIPAEIQVRTIAMDFWATLEHQIKYKKNIKNEELIKRELKRCADEIASVDLSMQTIREIIKEM